MGAQRERFVSLPLQLVAEIPAFFPTGPSFRQVIPGFCEVRQFALIGLIELAFATPG